MSRWIISLACGTVIFSGIALASQPSSGSMPKGQPSRSDACAACHRDIYQMWRSSAHARSMEDQVFQGAYHETEAAQGAAVAWICLGCHAPAVEMTKDSRLDLKVSWEGVSCDICHGIVSVDLTGDRPELTYDIGPTKRGPIRDAASMAHEVEYSELHTTAAICAPCHEYKNAEGTPIMSTYSEWQQSAASRDGRMCQSCHMARTKADVVDPRVARIPEAQVNLHEVPGGHSIEMLNKALAVSTRYERKDGQLQIEVTLKNKGAGHSVPTGMPSRRVILDLKVRTGDGQVFQEQKIYSTSFTDAAGAPIERDSGYFAPGVKRVEDTRIAPDEQRVETFRAAVAPQTAAYLSTRLQYEHMPTGTEEDRTLITFFTSERTIPAGSGSGR